MNWAVILPLISTIATLALGIYLANSQRHKNEGDTALALSTATEKLLKPLNERIEAQDNKIGELTFQVEQQTLQLRQAGEEISALRVTVVELSKGIDMLVTQIETLGHKPVWERKNKRK